MRRGWGGWKIVGFLLILGCQILGNGSPTAWARGGNGVSSQLPAGPKVGVLDFKNWSYSGPPEEIQAWKRALIQALRRDPAWQVIDIPERPGYRELIAKGYRQALSYRGRWQVDLLLTAQLYAGAPSTQAGVDLYLIDPERWRSRQIRTTLRPDRKPSAVVLDWKRELGQQLAEMGKASPPLLAVSAPAHPQGGPAPDPLPGPPLSGEGAGPPGPASGIYVRLLSPSNGHITTDPEILIEGFASNSPQRGPAIDLLFVLDSSGSLRGAGGLPPTDPQNFRSRGAIHLIQKLPPSANLRVGVVDFDGVASLVAPLSEDRWAAIEAIQSLDQDGPTNISRGIELANAELILHGRQGAAKAEILFTDGQQPLHDSRFGNPFDPSVIDEAARAGIVLHTLGLGEDISEVDLKGIAQKTGGRFIHVTDPASLPQVFDHLNPLSSGIEKITLKAEGLSVKMQLSLFGGYFWGRAPLRPGPNLIEAQAISHSGATAVDQLFILRRKADDQREMAIQEPFYRRVLSRRAGTPAEDPVHLSLDAPHPRQLKLEKQTPPSGPTHLNLDLYVK